MQNVYCTMPLVYNSRGAEQKWVKLTVQLKFGTGLFEKDCKTMLA